MNAADLNDVGRDGSGGLGDEMAIDEHCRRRNSRAPVVRFRLGVLVPRIAVRKHERAVRQQGGVGEPPDERVGDGVPSHDVWHGRGVRHMPEKRAFEERDHRRRHHVHQRHVQLRGHVRHTVQPQGLDDNHVETGRPAVGALQQRPEPAVSVDRVAVGPGHAGGDPERGDRIAELTDHSGRVCVQPPRKVGRHVHLRVVVAVAVRERREHGHAVPAVGQRPEHRAHHVPVAFARHHLHGQNPNAVRRRHYGRANEREEYRDRRIRHFQR